VVNEEGATVQGDEDVVRVHVGRTAPWVALQRVEDLDAAVKEAVVHVCRHKSVVESLVRGMGSGAVGKERGRRVMVAGAARERDGEGELAERGGRGERAAE
jgi:hypothetical protein